MNDTREEFIADLGNPYINPTTEELELLFSYIEKENEIVKEFDKEDGIDVESDSYVPDSMIIKRLSIMEDYRVAKTVLASVNKMIKEGLVSKDIDYVASLDEKQRRKHNNALTALMGMNDFARRNGLKEIYTGELVDKNDIIGLGIGNLDARIEMTNFFLNLLTQVSTYNIREIKNQQMKKQLNSIQKKIDKTNVDYKVKKELKTYDGEIEFYD